MRAVVCGANGAMGQLICAALGEAPVGKVSVDGENGACKHFSELPDVKPEVVIDFSHIALWQTCFVTPWHRTAPLSSVPPAIRRKKSS